ncbi:MAG: hypothetical protein ACOCZU_01620 [Planctomycetota bacterium]
MSDQNRTRSKRRGWLVLLAAVLLLAAAGGAVRGCGEGEEFVAPTTQPADSDQPVDPLVGRWTGTWTSDGIHGSGELVSVIDKQGEGEYLATFRARFGGGLFSMTQRDVTLVITGRAGKRVTFKGEKDLGFMNGGVYTYVGHAEDGTFEARYDSSFDSGVFTMERTPHDAKELAEPNAAG